MCKKIIEKGWKKHENVLLRIAMIKKGKNQTMNLLAFLEQKPQNELFIWKDNEKLNKTTKHGM